MMDKPSASELLQALKHFLSETAAPSLSGHAAFHARVAINVIGILERELGQWPDEAAAAETRLKALLGADGDLPTLTRALCQAIRVGSIALDDPALAEHLWQVTRAKVAIDQPGYSGLKGL